MELFREQKDITSNLEYKILSNEEILNDESFSLSPLKYIEKEEIKEVIDKDKLILEIQNSKDSIDKMTKDLVNIIDKIKKLD